MSEKIAAILDQYAPARYEVRPYGDHHVVWDTYNEVTVASFMHYDSEVRADRCAARMNG